MPQYKLYYFDGRGRAEVIRLIFAYAGQEYEDIRVKMDEWPQYKPKMPLGQMPVLEMDGVMMPQSKAIGRYLANVYGLAGKTDLEKYWADVFIDIFEDTSKKYPVAEKDETKKKQLMETFLNTTVPEQLQKVEKLFLQNNDGKECFLVGELKAVDFAFMTFVDFLLPMKDDILKSVTELEKLYSRIRNVDKIRPWLESRPKTQF